MISCIINSHYFKAYPMPFSKQTITALFLLACVSCGSQPETTEATPVTQDTLTAAALPASTDSITHYAHDPYTTGTDTARLNAAMHKIYQLAEVQEIDSIIRQSTQGKHGVAFMMENGWNQDTTYYRFIVGNNAHEDRYETIFNFVLDKKTEEIKIYDPLVDSLLSIEDWRKTKP